MVSTVESYQRSGSRTVWITLASGNVSSSSSHTTDAGKSTAEPKPAKSASQSTSWPRATRSHDRACDGRLNTSSMW